MHKSEVGVAKVILGFTSRIRPVVYTYVEQVAGSIVIPAAMFNQEYCILFMICIGFCQENKAKYYD